jgi:hypothetical protein
VHGREKEGHGLLRRMGPAEGQRACTTGPPYRRARLQQIRPYL